MGPTDGSLSKGPDLHLNPLTCSSSSQQASFMCKYRNSVAIIKQLPLECGLHNPASSSVLIITTRVPYVLVLRHMQGKQTLESMQGKVPKVMESLVVVHEVQHLAYSKIVSIAPIKLFDAKVSPITKYSDCF